ncbi:MAG TPA: Crp/Fnr family transcriptional regulator [Caulobacteraceae bacterium]|nr:Crp/Fnr family transcriptional regulator [Caulobacteraceae bacterium]
MGNPFIANLSHYVKLTGGESAALDILLGKRVPFGPGDELVTPGRAGRHCHVLLQGQAFRHRNLADGRRQILLFQAPGDVLDLQGLFLGLDHEVTALSRGEMAIVPHEAMDALLDVNGNIARGLWRLSLVEAAIFREWMVGMGRRSAHARIAHLLCEVFVRLRVTGIAQGDRCPFPVTQTHLSDALGLSVVHTNRVLQTLRADGVADVRQGQLVVRDWQRLKLAGEFDPAYLHLAAAAA